MDPAYKSESMELDVWQKLEARVHTEEDRRGLALASMVLISLRGFVTVTEGHRGRSTRAVLAEMNRDRAWAQKLPSVLTKPLHAYWNRQEQELYEYLLPQDVRQRAVDSVSCQGKSWERIMRRCLETWGSDLEAVRDAKEVVTVDGRQAFQQQYLEQLRVQLEESSIQPLLDQVIGKKEVRSRIKTAGASLKHWPIVGEAIWALYKLLFPLYMRPPAPESKAASNVMTDDPPAYPHALLVDTATLFRTEFPDLLSDLTFKDVLSRVQYRHQTARQQLASDHSPPKALES